MNIFKRKIDNNMVILMLCLKSVRISPSKCILRHIYELCNRYIQISDLYQSSLTSRVEIEALNFKCEIFYKIESEFCSLVFYEDSSLKFNENGPTPVKPRIYTKEKFSFFIDKNMFLPSFIHLFIHFCIDEVDYFSNTELFSKKNARLPLLSLNEQKNFLINLLKN